MLRTKIVSILRHDTSIFIPMFFNNLHTSHIEKSISKKNKKCGEAIPVAVVSIILRFTFHSKKNFSYNKQKYNSKIFAQNL